jgi:ribonuclease P protein component
MNHALGKSERLHARDFRCAKWTGSGRSPHFLLFKSANDQSIARFGVVVSRKIKGAVKRNRIKRLVREFIRLHKHLFHGSADYSVRVTRMPSGLTREAVRMELATLASRAFNG